MAVQREDRRRDSRANVPVLKPRDVERRFQEAVREAVAAHLAAGRPVYYGGQGPDEGRLYMRLPDGRRFEYVRRADGSRDIVREVCP